MDDEKQIKLFVASTISEPIKYQRELNKESKFPI